VLAAAVEASAERAPEREPSEHRASLPTGVDARWIELGDPRGEPVLFLHGITDTSRSFLGTMRALAELRPELRLIALDQRGHGGTSLPRGDACPDEPGSCFAPSLLAADALALLDHLGIARTHVVGHSLGSLVGQELALSHPGRVDRLVLVASSAHFGGNPGVLEFVAGCLADGPWKTALSESARSFPRDAWTRKPLEIEGAEAALAASWVNEPGTEPRLLAAILPETVRVPLGTWIGVPRALRGSDNRERLAGLRAPTLVLAAIQDPMFPEEPYQRELRAALARANERHGTPWAWKRYGRSAPTASGVLTDLAHNFHWAVPDAVARDLAAFLRPDGAPTSEEAFLSSGGAPSYQESGAFILPAPVE
jgi:pimeloyl-ACP methyl ester carboxylesterase